MRSQQGSRVAQSHGSWSVESRTADPARAIGEVWARATGNLYLMASAKDDQGRGPLAQLLAHVD